MNGTEICTIKWDKVSQTYILKASGRAHTVQIISTEIGLLSNKFNSNDLISKETVV
jgi:hypothetical protein